MENPTETGEANNNGEAVGAEKISVEQLYAKKIWAFFDPYDLNKDGILTKLETKIHNDQKGAKPFNPNNINPDDRGAPVWLAMKLTKDILDYKKDAIAKGGTANLDDKILIELDPLATREDCEKISGMPVFNIETFKSYIAAFKNDPNAMNDPKFTDIRDYQKAALKDYSVDFNQELDGLLKSLEDANVDKDNFVTVAELCEKYGSIDNVVPSIRNNKQNKGSQTLPNR